MGRRPKGAPRPIKQLNPGCIESVIYSWEAEGEKFEVRHVSSARQHGTHVRIVLLDDKFDRELTRVFLARGHKFSDVKKLGNTAFDLTYPPDDNMEDNNDEPDNYNGLGYDDID